MAIAFKADGGYNNAGQVTGTATVTLTVPTNTNGDLLIMFASSLDSTSAKNITTPAGWTSYTSIASNGDSLGPFFTKLHIFYRYASSEPGTYNVTCSGMAGGAASGIEGNIRSYSGASGPFGVGNPFNSNNSVITTNAGKTTSTVPAFTETFDPGELYVVIGLGQLGGTNPSVSNYNPATSDSFFNAGNFNSYNIADYSPSSSPGSMVLTWSSTLGGVNDAIALAFTLLPTLLWVTSPNIVQPTITTLSLINKTSQASVTRKRKNLLGKF